MAFFKDPEVDAKYQPKNEGDPTIIKAIQYRGPLSEVPMAIADALFKGGSIDAKKVSKAAASADTEKTKSK